MPKVCIETFDTPSFYTLRYFLDFRLQPATYAYAICPYTEFDNLWQEVDEAEKLAYDKEQEENMQAEIGE